MNKKGFTLVEILAVIVILALIIVIVSTNGFGAFDKAKEKINKEDDKAITEAIEVLMVDIEHCSDHEDFKFLDSSIESCNILKEKTKNGVTFTLKNLIEKNYISGNNIEKLKEIKVEEQPTFTIVFEYEEDNINLPVKEKIIGCINCDVIKEESIPEKLVNIIKTDTRIKKNSDAPEFTGIETIEKGMYRAQDDYGTSWYFRGKQSYNYVNFAGFTWRIVRINGDGSIRLILNGTLEKVTKEGETKKVYQNPALSSLGIDTSGQVAFTNVDNDNAYLGYMYGLIGATENVCVVTIDGIKSIDSSMTSEEDCTGEWMSGYDATHMNINDSTIKKYIDTFYSVYLKSYEEYLADTLFCGDKTLASSGIGNVATQLGYGLNKSYYASSERLYYSTGNSKIITAKPTLECAKNVPNTYSRYTSNSDKTPKGVNVNKDLTYPIGLLSADELVMAGGWRTPNHDFYLEDAYYNTNPRILHMNWFTMTPGLSSKTETGGKVYYAGMFWGSAGKTIEGGGNEKDVNSLRLNLAAFQIGVRPVINLKSNVKVSKGDGTREYPYEIEVATY